VVDVEKYYRGPSIQTYGSAVMNCRRSFRKAILTLPEKQRIVFKYEIF